MGDFITGIGSLERCICGILLAGIVAGFRVDGKLGHEFAVEFHGSGNGSRNLDGFGIDISGRVLACEIKDLSAPLQFCHAVLSFVFEHVNGRIVHRSVRNLIPFFRRFVPLPLAV